MLTLSSTNEEILKELGRGFHELMAHYKNHCGGVKRYEKMRDKLLVKAVREQKTQFGEVYEYITKDGNRWRVFDHAYYFPESCGAHTNVTSFVYYETFGSCGAFVPVHIDGEKQRSAIIFTSHFFLRLCQRIGVEYRSSAMIKTFLELIPSMIVMKKESMRFGKREVAVGLPGSIGNGVIRYEDGNRYVIEIDSFLKNTELSKKQRNEVEQLHKAQQVVKYEPEDMKQARYNRMIDESESVCDGIEAVRNDALQNMVSIGHNKEIVECMQNLFIWASTLVIEQSTKQEQDKMRKLINAKKMSNKNQDAYDAACRCILYNEPWMNQVKEMFILARNLAPHMIGREIDMERAYVKYMKAVNPNWDDRDLSNLRKELDEYEAKVEEFNSKHMKK